MLLVVAGVATADGPGQPDAPDEVVREALDRVTTEGYRGTVIDLTDFGNRYAGSPSDAQAAQWIRDQFNESGLETYFDEFQDTQNVVGIKEPDRANSTGYIVVGGHMDGVASTVEGAEDNASGTAALVALARAMEGLAVDVEVRFIAFGMEEAGLVGSSHYADNAAQRGDTIHAMFNADMVSYSQDGHGVTLFENSASSWLADHVVETRETYEDRVGLDAVLRAPGGANSDHWPFWQNGYDAVFLHSEDFSPCWHDPCDTTDTLNWTYGRSTTRLLGASAAEIAGLHRYADPAVEELRVLDEAPVEGDMVTVEATVANRGEGGLDAIAVQLEHGDDTVARRNVSLAAGQTRTVELAWDTGGHVGEQTLTATIDPGDALRELDETNNRASTTLWIAAPDLTARGPHELAWEPEPTNPWRVTVEATVENVETTPSEAFAVGFYHDRIAPETRFDTVHVDGLEPGASVTVAGTWESSAPGNRTIHVVADADGAVAELDEANNGAEDTYPLFLGIPVKADVPDPQEGVELRDEDGDGVPRVWWYERTYWAEGSGVGVQEKNSDGWSDSGVGDPDE